MDASLPPEQLAGIRAALEDICTEWVSYRNLKTRMGESLVFITLDVIVPEHWSVRRGRDWRERIESRLKETIPRAQAATHLEPSAKASDVKLRREAKHRTDQSDLSDAAFTRFSGAPRSAWRKMLLQHFDQLNDRRVEHPDKERRQNKHFDRQQEIAAKRQIDHEVDRPRHATHCQRKRCHFSTDERQSTSFPLNPDFC
jgi:hypothetical protein